MQYSLSSHDVQLCRVDTLCSPTLMLAYENALGYSSSVFRKALHS